MVEWWPPKDMSMSYFPGPVTMILIGKGAFVDAIKSRSLRLDHPRAFRWALNPMTSVLQRERRRKDTGIDQ